MAWSVHVRGRMSCFPIFYVLLLTFLMPRYQRDFGTFADASAGPAGAQWIRGRVALALFEARQQVGFAGPHADRGFLIEGNARGGGFAQAAQRLVAAEFAVPANSNRISGPVNT